MLTDIPFLEKKSKGTKISSSNEEVDIVDKKRALKRWKQSFSYYSLHPDKFKFSFKDFK